MLEQTFKNNLLGGSGGGGGGGGGGSGGQILGRPVVPGVRPDDPYVSVPPGDILRFYDVEEYS